MNILLRKIFSSLALILLFPLCVFSHAPEQSYLYLRVFEEKIEGTIEITSQDLNRALGLSLEEGLTEESLSPYLPKMHDYLLEHVKIRSALGEHPISFTNIKFLEVAKIGEFVLFDFDLGNTSQNIPDEMEIMYDILLDIDEMHRGLLVIGHNWKAGIIKNEGMTSLIFSPNDRKQTLLLTKGSLWQGFKAMVKLGMWHIWIGLDHILFLLALVLPAVVRRQWQSASLTDPTFAHAHISHNKSFFSVGNWIPVQRFKPAFIYIVKIVTFFTIAHSLTLSLAALEIVILPSRFVETVIALSIGLAAYHNINPIFKKNEWIIAFGFGLFHGFGFASVLSGKGLSGEFMTLSLLGFNLGVEIGQVAILCLIFPVLFFLRKSVSYPKIILYGSILLIMIALFWATERMFDINLLLDDYLIKIYQKGMKIIGLRS
jgi:hypothetical protein